LVEYLENLFSIIFFNSPLFSNLELLSRNFQLISGIILEINISHKLSFHIAIEISQSKVLKNPKGKIALSQFQTSPGFFQLREVSIIFCSVI